MSEKSATLAKRRAELVARADRQRREMAAYYSHCERSLQVVDTGWRLISTIREHPLVVSGIAALAGRFFAGRLFGKRFELVQNLTSWSGRIAVAWQLFTKIRDAFARPRP